MIEALYCKYLECGGRVTTDSRAIQGGELFFALKGETFNGNLYALKAVEAGAAYAVVDDSCPDEDPRLIRVENTLTALWDLAAWHREHLAVPTVVEGGVKTGEKRLTVVGLTGTNGKTTTKELIKAVLSTRFRLSATVGNLNNNIGVPLTVLKFNQDTELGLVEMGASHPGDIRELVVIARPDIGLITNVGKAHLLGFGSFEGVKATKGELYDFIAENSAAGVGTGKIFINQDNAHLLGMAMMRPSLKTVPYGVKAQDAQILVADGDHPFLRMVVDGVRIDTNLVGAYNADNVMAAIAVGRYFGVSLEDAAAAISAFVPSNNRSQMNRTERNTLIVDAYNANPSSMTVALENFSMVAASCKIALLGDMRELGAESLDEHRRIYDMVQCYISEGKITRAFFVGEEFGKVISEAGREGESYPDSQTLAEVLKTMDIKNATLLIKGSRGIKMENVIPVL